LTPANAADTQALSLNLSIQNPIAAKLFLLAKGPVERILRLERIRSLYGCISGPSSGKAFLENALELLRIRCEIDGTGLENIPSKGPVIVVCNHPFGVVDPMVLLSAALSVRHDAKVMGNYLLSRIPELQDVLIPVNPFGGNAATRQNSHALRQCLRVLKAEQLLCLFPAGTVSHAHIRRSRPIVTDPPWNPTACRLACKTGAAVVPAFVSGRNSALFQIAGLVHPALRTALLPRETVKMQGGLVRIRIGAPIPAERLRRIPDDMERTAYLRSRTYLLADDRESRVRVFLRRSNPVRLAPLAPPQQSHVLLREIRDLPQGQTLLETSNFRVFQAMAGQIPSLMKEIARLRELTFRSEQEGTGRAMDMDGFDAYYRHLVLWDRERGRVAGAYRMGLSEEILSAFGARGFYTRTLFRFGRRFLGRVTPAIELGRSFVRTEYQKSYQPLFLLWKGIARFVFLNPQYCRLFGPVSITGAYRTQSRRIMAAFLRENNQVTELARRIHPKHPFQKGPSKHRELKRAMVPLKDIRDLSDLISEIEDDRKGVPVLIRQYLRLGGVVLGFNVDPNFRDSLDALVLVDLTRTDPHLLSRYMGKDETEAFLRSHAHGDMARCA
jgi:putative hemolysin